MAASPSPAVPGMMQQQMDPLAELRDIHMPAPIETWPPAPGWWLLAALATALVIYLIYLAIKHWRANRYRREALAEMSVLLNTWHEDGNDKAYIEALQQLLKRVALTTFPREDVASLTGEAWVQFLDRSSGSHDFSMGEAEVLIDGNYRPDVSIDVPALHSAAAQWIKQHHTKHLDPFLLQKHTPGAVEGGDPHLTGRSIA